MTKNTHGTDQSDRLRSEVDLDDTFGEHITEGTADPPAPKRRTFDPRIAQDRRTIEQALKKEFEAAKQRVFAKLGSRGAGFVASASFNVRVKSTPGASKVIDEIIARVLTPTGAMQTQTAIRTAVQAMHPSNATPKDWTKRLPAWAVRKLKMRVQGSAAPFNTLNVKAGITLSQLHRAAKSAIQRHRNGTTQYKADVSVSDDAVIVNRKSFKLSTNKGNGKEYKMVRMSIATLVKALEAR